MEEENTIDNTLVAAQIHSMLPDGEHTSIPDKSQFMTYVASSSEVNKESLKSNWAFHNKDIATSRLNHDNILGIFNLHRAMKLMKLKELPTQNFTDTMLNNHYNECIETYIRGMKSLMGFTVKQISQITDVKIIKKDDDKNRGGL
jgi:hypothetical protein